MTNAYNAPILITGGARRIGLALAHALLAQGTPVIVAYRSEYPALDGLRQAGAICIQGDFTQTQEIYQFAEQIKSCTPKLRAVIHNASAWLAETAEIAPEDTLAKW